MNASLFLGILVAMAILNIWLGKRAADTTQTEDDFYLGGRSLGLLPLSLTILATQIGGGTLLGAAEEAYLRGWVVLLYPLGTCLGLVMVAMGFGARVRDMNLSTIPELFEKVYGCVYLRQWASLVSITTLFIILVAQGIAARKFFASVGFEGHTVFLVFWAILTLYTVMGGLKAVVNTDILQVIFIIVAFAVAFFGARMEPSLQPVVFENREVPWIGWLFMPLLFMFIEQDMGQRFFAAKSARSVTIGALVAAGVFLLCSFIPIYFGVRAAQMGLEVPEGQSVLLYVVTTVTNPVVGTVVTVGILMAIISTADTLLCSISSNIGYDFPVLRNRHVGWAQGITLAVAAFSLVGAYTLSNVVSVLIYSYELSVSALFVPVFMAVFGKYHGKGAAYASAGLGALSFGLFQFLEAPIPRELLSIGLSFSGYFLAGRFAKN